MKIRTVEKDRRNDRFGKRKRMNKKLGSGWLSTHNFMRSDNLSTDLYTITFSACIKALFVKQSQHF